MGVEPSLKLVDHFVTLPPPSPQKRVFNRRRLSFPLLPLDESYVRGFHTNTDHIYIIESGILIENHHYLEHSLYCNEFEGARRDRNTVTHLKFRLVGELEDKDPDAGSGHGGGGVEAGRDLPLAHEDDRGETRMRAYVLQAQADITQLSSGGRSVYCDSCLSCASFSSSWRLSRSLLL